MVVLIIFPVILQTDINLIMLSTGGQGVLVFKKGLVYSINHCSFPAQFIIHVSRDIVRVVNVPMSEKEDVQLNLSSRTEPMLPVNNILHIKCTISSTDQWQLIITISLHSSVMTKTCMTQVCAQHPTQSQEEQRP